MLRSSDMRLPTCRQLSKWYLLGRACAPKAPYLPKVGTLPKLGTYRYRCQSEVKARGDRIGQHKEGIWAEPLASTYQLLIP